MAALISMQEMFIITRLLLYKQFIAIVQTNITIPLNKKVHHLCDVYIGEIITDKVECTSAVVIFHIWIYQNSK